MNAHNIREVIRNEKKSSIREAYGDLCWADAPESSLSAYISFVFASSLQSTDTDHSSAPGESQPLNYMRK